MDRLFVPLERDWSKSHLNWKIEIPTTYIYFSPTSKFKILSQPSKFVKSKLFCSPTQKYKNQNWIHFLKRETERKNSNCRRPLYSETSKVIEKCCIDPQIYAEVVNFWGRVKAKQLYNKEVAQLRNKTLKTFLRFCVHIYCRFYESK